ncbi:general secretion pathway protein GspB [Oryzomonas rubra]|uniref:General secretion pathway protein B n=1 Tax=Oryzomonas rubra TaxID=2509454 RepID=A0A5A9XQS6_9BACT|nr:general secretion pathway protein GspB [Oryzomonas rubra]KAA0895170.1 hypothetical protein ET418_01220 [Oryzomonas rubra]
MSSILKALKKLEEEKSARTPDALKIDTEILRGGSSSRFPYRNVTLLAVLFFICGSLFTYLYVKRGANPAGTAAPNVPSPERTIPPRAAVTEDPGKVVPAGRPRRQAQDAPVPVSVAVPHAKPPKHTRAAMPATAGHAQPSAVAQPVVTVPSAPSRRIPTLRVDGIAYHFGSADSLAVVNGNTVFVGATVEGVKVEDIGKDHIRFSYGGEKFDVPLGKSN